MRAIQLARLDKTRPALILTRELVLPYLTRVTVAPITSTVKGLGSEVAAARPTARPDQEDELREALIYAFGLLGNDPAPNG